MAQAGSPKARRPTPFGHRSRRRAAVGGGEDDPFAARCAVEFVDAGTLRFALDRGASMTRAHSTCGLDARSPAPRRVTLPSAVHRAVRTSSSAADRHDLTEDRERRRASFASSTTGRSRRATTSARRGASGSSRGRVRACRGRSFWQFGERLTPLYATQVSLAMEDHRVRRSQRIPRLRLSRPCTPLPSRVRDEVKLELKSRWVTGFRRRGAAGQRGRDDLVGDARLGHASHSSPAETKTRVPPFNRTTLLPRVPLDSSA